MMMKGISRRPFPHCQHHSMPHWQWCSAHVLIGLGGHLWIQKWSDIIFFKVVPNSLAVLKQVV